MTVEDVSSDYVIYGTLNYQAPALPVTELFKSLVSMTPDSMKHIF